MIPSISLSPEVYALLRQRAQQGQISADALAEEALRHYLGLEEQTWQQAFESLIARVQSRTASFSSQEIETDISAAALEVQELRRASRRAG